MLELSGVRRTLTLPGGRSIEVLRGVDLTVEQGEAVAVVGRSGSGKSTLLNLVGLLDRADSGSYSIDGRDVADLDDDAQSDLRGRTFGFVFQSFNLLDRRSAATNVGLPLLYETGIRRSERRRRSEDLLRQVGLADRSRSTPSQLSGGEQQRVALARSLVRRPRYLLCDEPTGSLDVATAGMVLDVLMATVRDRGCGLLLITHDPVVAARADRTVELDGGCIRPVGR